MQHSVCALWLGYLAARAAAELSRRWRLASPVRNAVVRPSMCCDPHDCRATTGLDVRMRKRIPSQKKHFRGEVTSTGVQIHEWVSVKIDSCTIATRLWIRLLHGLLAPIPAMISSSLVSIHPGLRLVFLESSILISTEVARPRSIEVSLRSCF
jgi:hypothetical protein